MTWPERKVLLGCSSKGVATLAYSMSQSVADGILIEVVLSKKKCTYTQMGNWLGHLLSQKIIAFPEHLLRPAIGTPIIKVCPIVSSKLSPPHQRKALFQNPKKWMICVWSTKTEMSVPFVIMIEKNRLRGVISSCPKTPQTQDTSSVLPYEENAVLMLPFL